MAIIDPKNGAYQTWRLGWVGDKEKGWVVKTKGGARAQTFQFTNINSTLSAKHSYRCWKYKSGHNNLVVSYMCRVYLKINAKWEIKHCRDIENSVKGKVTIFDGISWEGPTEKMMLCKDPQEIRQQRALGDMHFRQRAQKMQEPCTGVSLVFPRARSPGWPDAD